jgi:transcriptional antiterminator RfaH
MGAVIPAKILGLEGQVIKEAALRCEPVPLFAPGERVLVTEGPFAGIEGIYQMTDGESRVMVLIELLAKQVRVPVAPASLRKVG